MILVVFKFARKDCCPRDKGRRRSCPFMVLTLCVTTSNFVIRMDESIGCLIRSESGLASVRIGISLVIYSVAQQVPNALQRSFVTIATGHES